jgi:hypothetical protein
MGEPRLPALAGALTVRAREIRDGIEPGRLRQHVERLAEPRSHRHAAEGMARAEAYVVGELESCGWPVARRPFAMAGAEAANLLAERADGGGRPAYLVGAHLDTVPGSPGADDNASGVACILELARLLAPLRLDHDVLLAVFDEEETGLIGSGLLAEELSTERTLTGVVIYECVGHYPTSPGSQAMPPGAGLIYPAQVGRMKRRGFRGEWTLFAYRGSSFRLAGTLGAFLAYLAGPDAVMLARDPLDFPVLGRLLRLYPALTRHFARSDHKPFWDLGIPAVQVTDTANFRNPRYHQPEDTPDTLDYERMADIVAATAATLIGPAGGLPWPGALSSVA